MPGSAMVVIVCYRYCRSLDWAVQLSCTRAVCPGYEIIGAACKNLKPLV